MKNIKINHQFTLKEILISIDKIGVKATNYEDGYDYMRFKIKKYLEMIE